MDLHEALRIAADHFHGMADDAEYAEDHSRAKEYAAIAAALRGAMGREEWQKHADDLALLLDMLIRHAHAVHHDEAEAILRLHGKPPENISADVTAAKAGLAAYHALKESA